MAQDGGLGPPGLGIEFLGGAGHMIATGPIQGLLDGDRVWTEAEEVVDRSSSAGPWDTSRSALTRPSGAGSETLTFDLQSARPQHLLSGGVDWLVFAEVPDGPILGESHSTPVLIAWPAEEPPLLVPLPIRTEVDVVAADGSGGIWLGGVAPGSSDFGDGPIRPEGGTPAFIAHVDGDGESAGHLLAGPAQLEEMLPFGDGLLALVLAVDGGGSIYDTTVDSGRLVAIIDPTTEALLSHWPMSADEVWLRAMGDQLRIVFRFASDPVSFGAETYDPLDGPAETYVDLTWNGTSSPPSGERWVVSPLAVDEDGVTFVPLGADAGLVREPFDTSWVFTVMESPVRASLGVWASETAPYPFRRRAGSWVVAAFDSADDLTVGEETLESVNPTQWMVRFALDGGIADSIAFPLQEPSQGDSFSTALGPEQILHLAAPASAGSDLPIAIFDWSGSEIASAQVLSEGDDCSLFWLNGGTHSDFRLITQCRGPHTLSIGDGTDAFEVEYGSNGSMTRLRFSYVE